MGSQVSRCLYPDDCRTPLKCAATGQCQKTLPDHRPPEVSHPSRLLKRWETIPLGELRSIIDRYVTQSLPVGIGSTISYSIHQSTDDWVVHIFAAEDWPVFHTVPLSFLVDWNADTQRSVLGWGE